MGFKQISWLRERDFFLVSINLTHTLAHFDIHIHIFSIFRAIFFLSISRGFNLFFCSALLAFSIVQKISVASCHFSIWVLMILSLWSIQRLVLGALRYPSWPEFGSISISKHLKWTDFQYLFYKIEFLSENRFVYTIFPLFKILILFVQNLTWFTD